MLFTWHFNENPYKENLFKKARISTAEIRPRNISAILQNARLQDHKDRLLKPDNRFAEELLAHKAHSIDRRPLEGFLQDFASVPIELADLEATELTVVDITKLVVLPEKGLDPQVQKVKFSRPPLSDKETFMEEVLLDY
jgi:hypothetical protein